LHSKERFTIPQPYTVDGFKEYIINLVNFMAAGLWQC
jgi:hypothetical protein